ncbi:hypothetical protein BJ170DRAFT_229465 [Xylariales sp. AK1849]|nr:hypothetical protein BJ170DRAFT_229465 [Xylariales sp. AK1849]
MDPVLSWKAMEQTWLEEGLFGKKPPALDEDGDIVPMGREYVKACLAPKFAQFEMDGNKSTVFVVSPLTRVLQTFLIAAPYNTLRSATIILEPLIIEQTRWFSDRVRPSTHIEKLIKTELKLRETPEGQSELHFDDLDIDWSKLAEAPNYVTGKAANLQNGLTQWKPETEDRPWYLKDGLWAPENLIERGKRATQQVIQVCRNARKGSVYAEYTVCLFGHGGFVNFIVGELGNVAFEEDAVVGTTEWSTGELREYEVVDKDDSMPPQPYYFVETKQSRSNRKRKEEKPDVPYSVEEESKKRELQRIYIVKQTKEKLGETAEARQLYAEADEERKNPNEVKGNNLTYINNVDGRPAGDHLI